MHKSPNVELPKEEYDFEILLADKLVSADELEVCYEYEFTREVPQARRAIAEFKSTARKFISEMSDILGGGLDADFPPRSGVPIRPGYFGFFINYPEWPDTPYFQIASDIREKRLRALMEDKTTDEALAKRLELPLGIENPNLWPQTTITIPSYYTHEDLIEAFAALLRQRFPEQGKNGAPSRKLVRVGRKQGRGAPNQQHRNALRALGVHRLLRSGVKPSEVKELLRYADGQHMYTTKKDGPIHRTDKAARQRIKEFQNLAAMVYPQTSKGVVA
jgi:hypothetical protein